jgi:hypothetical protein
MITKAQKERNRIHESNKVIRDATPINPLHVNIFTAYDEPVYHPTNSANVTYGHYEVACNKPDYDPKAQLDAYEMWHDENYDHVEMDKCAEVLGFVLPSVKAAERVAQRRLDDPRYDVHTYDNIGDFLANGRHYNNVHQHPLSKDESDKAVTTKLKYFINK